MSGTSAPCPGCGQVGLVFHCAGYAASACDLFKCERCGTIGELRVLDDEPGRVHVPPRPQKRR